MLRSAGTPAWSSSSGRSAARISDGRTIDGRTGAKRTTGSLTTDGRTTDAGEVWLLSLRDPNRDDGCRAVRLGARIRTRGGEP
jgi:hypothetical protein